MLIKRKSMLTGKEHEMDLPITQEQIDRFMRGELLQRVFPELSAGEREFFKTGITPEEWDKAFPEEEE